MQSQTIRRARRSRSSGSIDLTGVARSGVFVSITAAAVALAMTTSAFAASPSPSPSSSPSPSASGEGTGSVFGATEPIFADDFSDESRWYVGEDDTTSYGYENGTYVARVKTDDRTAWSFKQLDETKPVVHVLGTV